MRLLLSHSVPAADTLYLCGGTYEPDRGCPAWGTSYSREMCSVGDPGGSIQISYTDGRQETIPLIFGYTLWFLTPWREGDAPFSTDDRCRSLLDETLHLGRVWEKDGRYLLKYRLTGPVSKITILPSERKDGEPVFHGLALLHQGRAVFCDGMEDVTLPAEDDPFFMTHTIDTNTPVPAEKLNEIKHALYLYPEEYHYSPAPGAHMFQGTPAADLLDRQQTENAADLMSRIDSEGFLHTSRLAAPNWNYFGFGAYHPSLGAYYDKLYSRDAGRTLMTLLDLGTMDEVERAIHVFHKWLMYFPENRLTIKGLEIPGHWTVMPNQPLIYSTYLVPECAWPTQYTKEAFGAGYQNLGNLEPDGHGLLMLAVWKYWETKGRPEEWAREQFPYLKEAAEFIVWCLGHPEVSLSKDDLLYGETEGAMNDYTMYANLPNMLGLFKYALIAAEIGETAYSDRWHRYASRLQAAIGASFTDGSCNEWKNFGFYHDPIPFLYYDISSPLLEDLPESWRKRSDATYQAERKEMANRHWYGSHGTGYDHCNFTQNALLLDYMADAERLVQNLTRFSYAPHLPEPFLVPESFSYDETQAMLRRQGDIGNLVQQAEMLKVTQIISGVKRCGEILYLVPRIFPNWTLKTDALETAYPTGGIQTARLTVPTGIKKTVFRAGPFPLHITELFAAANGKTIPVQVRQSGDSAWGIISLPGSGDYELRITTEKESLL